MHHWQTKKRQFESLFSQLKERHITVKSTLYKLLALTDSDQLVALCQKTALFFSHVDNTRVTNSGCLSNMLRRKKHIRDFVVQEDADIIALATSPWLLSMTNMCSGKGFAQGHLVRNLFSWPCLQVNDSFSSGLGRTLSSMLGGKGLPEEAEVKAILSWSCWWINGTFSSMFHGQGLPIDADVKAVLLWPCWQINGQFSSELFRSFSSIFHGKGLFQEADVKALLSWPVWQVNGQFNYELFRSFSSLNGKGLPSEKCVLACLNWLSGADDLDMDALETVSTLFASVFAKHRTSGIPDIDRLRAGEHQWLQLFPPSTAEDDHCRLQLKLAFYAASKGKGGSLTLEMMERFLKGYAGHFHPQSGSDLALTKKYLSNLYTLLLASGCQGVRKFLAEVAKKGWEMSEKEYDSLFTSLL